MDAVVVEKLLDFIKKNNSIPDNKLIHCLRLGNIFFNSLHNKFQNFILYNYICDIFKTPLNVCDKNTYTRKRLRCVNHNYISHKEKYNTDLINNEYTILMFVYNIYPMIHINLYKYDDVLESINTNNITKLFYYKECEDVIKIIFYVKQDSKFLIKIVDNLNKVNELEHTISNIEDSTEYHNTITSKLLCLKYIFINLKNINNK